MNDSMIEAGQSDAVVETVTTALSRAMVEIPRPIVFFAAREVVDRLRRSGMSDRAIQEAITHDH